MDKNKRNSSRRYKYRETYTGVMNNDLFSWLVEYHCRENLPQCLPYMKDGQAYPFGRPINEGEENELYKGLIIISNGDTLVNKLSCGHVINDDPNKLRYADISGKKDLWAYVNERRNKDGAYIFDGRNGRITKAAEVNNNPSTLPRGIDLSSMIPADFVYSDGTQIDESEDLGTKTRLAIRTPHAYEHTNTYQIKRTAYGNTGLGKVTHFGPQGLIEEFFFRYEPASNGPFINEKQGIVGVYRKYERDENNQLVKVLEQLVGNPKEYFKILLEDIKKDIAL